MISLLNRPSWPWPWDLRGTLKRKQVAFQRMRIQSKYFRKIQIKSESVTAVRGTTEGPLGYEWTYYCLSVCCLIIHNIIIASSFPLLSLCFLACCVCLSWGEYILHFSTIILKCYFLFQIETALQNELQKANIREEVIRSMVEKIQSNVMFFALFTPIIVVFLLALVDFVATVLLQVVNTELVSYLNITVALEGPRGEQGPTLKGRSAKIGVKKHFDCTIYWLNCFAMIFTLQSLYW